MGRTSDLARKSAIVTAAFALVATSLWYGIWLLIGDSWRYLGYFNAAGFAWGLTGLVAGLVLLVLRKPLWGLAAIILAIAILSRGVSFNLPQTNDKRHAGTFRVVTASLRTMNTDMKGAAANLLKLDPDIAALQEVNDPLALASELRNKSGQDWYAFSNGSTMVLSKARGTAIKAPREVLKVRLFVGEAKKIDIWTIHGPKNYLNPIENGLYYANLAEEIREQVPDIVAGDLNASPWNDGYQQIRNVLRSSFEEAGTGPGLTFSTPARRIGWIFPLVRIDHIFIGHRIKAFNAFVASASNGVDHYPVVADLVLE